MNEDSPFCHGEKRSDVAIHALPVGHVYPLVDCRGRLRLSRNDKV